MSQFVVLKQFEGRGGRQFSVGQRVDSDEYNTWVHGAKLVNQKYLAPAPAAKRGRKPKRG